MSQEPLPAGTYAAAISDALDELGLRDQVMDPAIRPLNPDTVLGKSSGFIPRVTTGLSAWNRPTSVMTPRTVKITLQHDF